MFSFCREKDKNITVFQTLSLYSYCAAPHHPPLDVQWAAIKYILGVLEMPGRTTAVILVEADQK